MGIVALIFGIRLWYACDYFLYFYPKRILYFNQCLKYSILMSLKSYMVALIT